MTHGGQVAEFTGPNETTTAYPNPVANCIALGSDRALYYLSGTSPVTIVRVSSSGEFSQVSLAADLATPGAIAAAPDGSLWFTVQSTSSGAWETGRYTPGAGLTPPTTTIRGQFLHPGPGRLWIGDTSGVQASVGWVGADDVFHPTNAFYAQDDADVGPDDRLWVGGWERINRFALDGNSWDSIQLYNYPNYDDYWGESAFAVGPDGEAYALASHFDTHEPALIRGEPYLGSSAPFELTLLPSGFAPGPIGHGGDGDIVFVDASTNSVYEIGVGEWVRFLQHLYKDMLGRSLDPGAADWFSTQWYDDETFSTTAMSTILANSDEYLLARVNRLYEQLLRRDAEPSGQQYWANLLRGGWRAETLEVALIGSDEYWNDQGHNDIDTYITAVYHDLLGRAPEPDGLAYWHNLLASGTNRMVVANGLVFSREALQKVVADLYVHYLDRGTDPGGLNYWTDQLQNGMTDETLVVLLTGSAEYYTNAQN